MNINDDLKNMCENIARELETGIYELNDPDSFEYDNEGDQCQGLKKGDASDYLMGALDIEYTMDSDGNYLGSKIVMAFGGPNVYVDTRSNCVEGYWDSNSIRVKFDDYMGLDDYLRELFENKFKAN